MGLNKHSYEKRTYVNIIGGQFAIKADDKNPNAVMRYSEKKKENVWELLYDDLSGTIKEIRVEDSQFGQQVIIGISDVGEYFEVQLPTEGKYFWHFAMKIPNVNMNEDVTLVPYSFESKTDKNQKGEPRRITGMNIMQKGAKVPYYYSNDLPNGKPTPERKDMDDVEYKIFRLKEKKFLVESLAKLQPKEEKVVEVDVPTGGGAFEPDDTSDGLPF